MRLAVRAFAPELNCLEIFRTSVINFKEPLVQLNKVSFEMLTLSHSSHTYPNVQAFSYVRLASFLLILKFGSAEPLVLNFWKQPPMLTTVELEFDFTM